MWSVLWGKFLKSALYSLIGSIVVVFGMAIQHLLTTGWEPQSAIHKLWWTVLFVPLLTGLVSLIRKYFAWEEEAKWKENMLRKMGFKESKIIEMKSKDEI